jgi:membrane-associated protein
LIEFLKTLVDLFLHLDVHLTNIVTEYGALTYAILFAVIFLETGVVVTPFLPGDSLLFAAGTLAALSVEGQEPPLNVFVIFILLFFAAVSGDTVNYWIGHKLGLRVFETKHPILKRVLKREYLEKTEAFYAKHGGKTIVLARFVPIVRTFAPFVAGVGTMEYRKFITYNVIGGFLWTALFTFAGYFFGNIEFVKHNFELVIIAIIGLSLVPMMIEYVRSRSHKTTTPVDAPVS